MTLKGGRVKEHYLKGLPQYCGGERNNFIIGKERVKEKKGTVSGNTDNVLGKEEKKGGKIHITLERQGKRGCAN